MTLAVIQNKIPTIKEEHLYKATCAVTTVALTALMYSAPGTFLLAGVGFSLTHTALFSKAASVLHPDYQPIMRVWMIVACAVSSAFIAATLPLSLPLLPYSIEALQALKMTEALFELTFVTGLIGFGGAAAKHLYKRGLKLTETTTWEPMRAHMESQVSISFFESCALTIGLFAPRQMLSYVPSKVSWILLNFGPAEEKEQRFFELMNIAISLPPRDVGLLQNKIFAIFNTLPLKKQISLLPNLKRINPNLLTQLPTATLEAINQRRNELAHQNETAGTTFQRRLETLTTRIDAIQQVTTNTANLDSISAEFTALRNEVTKFVSDVKLFCPDLAITNLTRLQAELMGGETFLNLQRLLNSQRSDDDQIDLDDPSWNYFLMNDSSGHANAGMEFIQQWLPIFKVNDLNELDFKLEENDLRTIGEFIEKVLGGDENLLKNTNKVLRRLKLYMETRNDSRGMMYAALAGGIGEKGSYAAELAGKAMYKTAMVITALAPMITYPYLFATGSLLGALYPTTRRSTRLRRLIEDLASRYQGIYTLATRRPYISLLTNATSGEMTSYAGADVLGKIRILAVEFFIGLIMLILTFDQHGQLEGLGGIIQGVAFGREVSEVAFG